MATRINNAKNFKGKSYVVSDEITNILNTLKYQNGTLMFQGSNVQDEANIGSSVSAVDIRGLIDFITKTENKIVTTDNTGHFAYTNAITSTVASSGSTVDTNIPNETAVRAAIDAVKNAAISVTGVNGITVSGGGTEKTIGNTIKLVKKATANTGYAASYQLMYLDGENYVELNDSDDIDIIKDQFLTNVELGYGTFVNADTVPTDWTTEKPAGETTLNTILKLTFAIGAKDSSGAASDTGIVKYINVDGMFHDKVAGNYINATDLASNKITVVVGNGIDGEVTSAITVKVDTSDTVYTTKGSAVAILSVTSNGVKVSGIQDAIDLAATDAYTKNATAISAVNTNVEALEGAINTNVSAAITTVNTKVDSAVTNVNTNVSAAITAVNGKVGSAVSSVNSAITSTVDSINTQVSAVVTEVNGNVSAVVTNVNAAITSNVTSINANVSAAITAVNSKVDGAVTAVNGAITSTVTNINTQVGAVVSKVVEIVDEEYTISSSYISSTDSARTVTVPNVSGKVLAVYGANGEQIYPTITKVTSDNVTTYTLTAEYGPNDTVDSAWSVLHTQAITYTNAEAVSATSPASTEYVNVVIQSAESVTGATYSAANASTASAGDNATYSAADDGTDATYTGVDYNNSTTVGELNYKQA